MDNSPETEFRVFGMRMRKAADSAPGNAYVSMLVEAANECRRPPGSYVAACGKLQHHLMRMGRPGQPRSPLWQLLTDVAHLIPFAWSDHAQGDISKHDKSTPQRSPGARPPVR